MVFLKKFIATGFKSFATRTEFVFDKQTEMMDTNQFIQMPAEDINYQIIVTNEDFEYLFKNN